MTTKEAELHPGLHGVRGWLLALCLFLLVAMPIVAVLGIIAAWQSASASPVIRTSLVSSVIIELGFAAFAAYAGWSLYHVRRNAVRIAKAYFITMLGLSAFGLIAIVMGAIAMPQNSDMAAFARLQGPMSVWALRQMIVSGVCLAYLARSRRVRTTYPKS